MIGHHDVFTVKRLLVKHFRKK